MSFSLAHPGLGPARRERARAREVGRDHRLAQRCLEGALPARAQHPRQALALSPATRAPYEPPRDPGPEQHIEVERPGELVGIDCFYVGRLQRHRGRDLAADRDRHPLLVCLGRARRLPSNGNPTAPPDQQASRAASPRELKAAGWRLERVLTDNGNEFKGDFRTTVAQLDARHTRIRAGRPQTNGHVEALHKTILDECWRPAFARYLHPASPAYAASSTPTSHYYNHDRVHHGRLTRGRIPADIVYGARKMEAR